MSDRAQRSQKPRIALLRAFADLVQKHHYDQIRVADIVRRANVGRSTFYEHFRGKDAILTSSIAGPLAVLADSIQPKTDVPALIELLEHFWINRALARGILLGPVRRKTIAVLVSQVELRLKLSVHSTKGNPLIPRRLVAIQVAEVMIAPVTAWLIGESRCTPEALARALPRAACAVLAASYDRTALTR